ncbi:hypothetical protein RF11_00431 [Thelohanellus kitauei]|uniref:Uncharacterized protein n=1 Tax=Thelohanellus kitauei TaxID=669202 RepID=A0A0C2JXN9_THEKT|nr:hypothetical protein RF11_00431 [Thelohanellus kitauei]
MNLLKGKQIADNFWCKKSGIGRKIGHKKLKNFKRKEQRVPRPTSVLFLTSLENVDIEILETMVLKSPIIDANRDLQWKSRTISQLTTAYIKKPEKASFVVHRVVDYNYAFYPDGS